MAGLKLTHFCLMGVCICAATLGLQHPKLKNYDNPNKVPYSYLVVLKDKSTGSSVRNAVSTKLQSDLGVEVQQVKESYDLGSLGLHIIPTDISSDQMLLDVLNTPEVQLVEAEVAVTPTCQQQTGASWGLRRMSGREQLSPDFRYEGNGTGVTIYVVDTGVNLQHQEFGGRATFGECVYISSNTQADVGNHGTGVASNAAGSTLGTAKGADIVSVRVFDDRGGSSTLAVFYGLAFVLNHHYNESLRLNPIATQASQHTVINATANFIRPRSVINLSLGSPGFSSTVDLALQLIEEYGIVTVSSAGNDGFDACQKHPASSPFTITVGCTDMNDHLCTFSNYGSCVDVLAPGDNIPMAGPTSPTAVLTQSGTSFSAPYTAGVIANYMSKAIRTPTPADVRTWLLNTATRGRVYMSQAAAPGTLNRLVFSGCGGAGSNHTYNTVSSITSDGNRLQSPTQRYWYVSVGLQVFFSFVLFLV